MRSNISLIYSSQAGVFFFFSVQGCNLVHASFQRAINESRKTIKAHFFLSRSLSAWEPVHVSVNEECFAAHKCSDSTCLDSMWWPGPAHCFENTAAAVYHAGSRVEDSRLPVHMPSYQPALSDLATRVNMFCKRKFSLGKHGRRAAKDMPAQILVFMGAGGGRL